MTTTLLDEVLTPEHLARGGPYLSVPFDVAPGTESFEVDLGFDPTVARIDLGCASPGGWRGWSGGARRRFVVGRRAATPGYLPGEPEAGAWSVVLGLHTVPADGVRVVVRLTAPGGPLPPEPPAPPPAPGRPPRDLPAPDGTRWLAADLHAHTVHSDGALTPAQLVALAARRGLDVLAVTDHNTTSHHAQLPALSARYGLLALPGQEVTTRHGHANVLGDVGWVDFRTHPDHWVRHAREAGGALSINHPVSGDCSWQWDLTEAPHAVEVAHESWLRDRSDTSVWAWLTASGLRPTLVSGGDFHDRRSGALPGTWVTWLAARERTTDGVVDAIRSGRTAVSLGVDGPVVLRHDGGLVLDRAAGLLLVDRGGRTVPVGSDRCRVPAGDGPYRLETDDREVVALCA